MCNEAVRKRPLNLKYVPNHFVTQEMCIEAVQRNPWMLEYVPHWSVTLQEMEEFDDDELITWPDAYIKRKTQKAQIKEELIPITWHPDRYWDWCVPED